MQPMSPANVLRILPECPKDLRAIFDDDDNEPNGVEHDRSFWEVKTQI